MDQRAGAAQQGLQIFLPEDAVYTASNRPGMEYHRVQEAESRPFRLWRSVETGKHMLKAMMRSSW